MKPSPPIPSRSNVNFCFHVGDYSFGFNGKELDKEGMGGGASTYDYGFRIYNSALAKFLSVDPLKKDYPWYTPYQFAGNKPIWAIDLDGLEEFMRTDYYTATGALYKTVIFMYSGYAAVDDVQIVHVNRVQENRDGSFTTTYLGTNVGTTQGTNAFQSGTAATDRIVNAANIRMQALNINAAGNRVRVPAMDILNTAPDGAPPVLVQAAWVEMVPSANSNDGEYVFMLFNAAGAPIGVRSNLSMNQNLPNTAQNRLPVTMDASPIVITQATVTAPNDQKPATENAIPNITRRILRVGALLNRLNLGSNNSPSN